jgi:hypothetical protein
MIIIKLSGGIGNQLFQYSLGRRLSIEKGVQLKFDISNYKNSSRPFKLNNFKIVGEIATADEISNFVSPFSNNYVNLIYRFFQKNIITNSNRIYDEKFLNFDSNVLHTSEDVYLSGYWQSYKYFEDYYSLFQEEFSLVSNPTYLDTKMQNINLTGDSVSIHFRRGDYVTNPRIKLLELEYYYSAVSYLNTQLCNPHYFVFSDDITWVKNNFYVENKITYINPNNYFDECNELLLMSRCSHHIIANSTFSWWGAWLGKDKQKKIIAPKYWYHDRPNFMDDLIPSDWIQL